MIIAVEGCDKAGKSTQCELLDSYLKQHGFNSEVFHFPNKESAFGRFIYGWLNHDPIYDGFSREVIELCHTSDKMNEQDYISQFKGNYNRTLILDRYELSQYVYALASDLDRDWVLNLTKLYIKPDIKIFLDIPPKETINRRGESDRYEKDLAFLNQVYSHYLDGCKEFGYKIVDASGTAEEVFNRIAKVVGGKMQ